MKIPKCGNCNRALASDAKQMSDVLLCSRCYEKAQDLFKNHEISVSHHTSKRKEY